MTFINLLIKNRSKVIDFKQKEIVGFLIRMKSMIEFGQLGIQIVDDLIRRPASPKLTLSFFISFQLVPPNQRRKTSTRLREPLNSEHTVPSFE